MRGTKFLQARSCGPRRACKERGPPFSGPKFKRGNCTAGDDGAFTTKQVKRWVRCDPRHMQGIIGEELPWRVLICFAPANRGKGCPPVGHWCLIVRERRHAVGNDLRQLHITCWFSVSYA